MTVRWYGERRYRFGLQAKVDRSLWETDEEMRREHPGRCLVVGQAPSRSSDGKPALFGVSGDRLATIAGLEPPPGIRPCWALLRACERINLLTEWPGGSEDGDEFPLDEATESAREVIASGLAAGRTVLLLGRGVADAFGVRRGWFRWSGDEEWCSRVGVVPHPSGCNHEWNDEETRRRGREFIRDAFGVGPLSEVDECQQSLFLR